MPTRPSSYSCPGLLATTRSPCCRFFTLSPLVPACPCPLPHAACSHCHEALIQRHFPQFTHGRDVTEQMPHEHAGTRTGTKTGITPGLRDDALERGAGCREGRVSPCAKRLGNALSSLLVSNLCLCAPERLRAG